MNRYILTVFLLMSIFGQAVECAVKGERILPRPYYLQGQDQLMIKIEITGEADSVVIQETIPPGWTLHRATNNASVNGRNLTWELASFSGITRVLYYVNTPDAAENDAQFSGTINGDPIGGESVMPLRQSIPAAGKHVPMYDSLYNYWLYLPSGYSDQEGQWPLLLFLHGCIVGTDLDLVLTHYGVSILTILENPDNAEIVPELFQSIVVSPQSTTTEWDIHRLKDFLNELFSTYSIDPNRVYVYGHAGGADAGWAMANEFPDLLAAFFSGGSMMTPPTVSAKMAGLPVRILEFETFQTIPHNVIESCVDELRALGGECVYTFVPWDSGFTVEDHYYDPELYKWFLKQNRQSRMGVETITVEIPNLDVEAKPLEMALIPAGTFTMGSSPDERRSDPSWSMPDADWPQHEVTITKPFYFGVYEVTQAQWMAIMGTNPASREGINIPVNNVTWIDCQEFIEKINELGLGTFRLPTEAEWEYACRAGTTTRFFYGDVLETDDLEEYSPIHDQYMWWKGNTVESETPLPVGLKLPNPWGLYDIHGNVWEWCEDWWEAPWDRGPQVDPTGPETGTVRVVRSGGALGYAQGCRSADRRCDFCTPDYQVPHMGFRLVREYEESSGIENFSLYQ